MSAPIDPALNDPLGDLLDMRAAIKQAIQLALANGGVIEYNLDGEGYRLLTVQQLQEALNSNLDQFVKEQNRTPHRRYINRVHRGI